MLEIVQKLLNLYLRDFKVVVVVTPPTTTMKKKLITT